MLFSKGKMRKRWVEGKDAAKDACVNKGEENYLKLFSKDDFGPTLDKVEDLLPKKSTKPKEYKKAWDDAYSVGKKLKKMTMDAGISEMSDKMRRALRSAIDDILLCLDSKDVKPS